MRGSSGKLKLKRRTPSPPRSGNSSGRTPTPSPPRSGNCSRRTPSPPRSGNSEPNKRRYDEEDKAKAKAKAVSDYSDYPTTLLVSNLSHRTRPEDLRIPFEKFGPVNDVYLPKNYYTGKPRGFGFVKYRNTDDAAEAKYHMNNQIICGHQISIAFAKEDAKRPDEMLGKEQNT